MVAKYARKSVVRKSTSKKVNISAYCLVCKKKCQIDTKAPLIKRKLPNGNTVTILCGKCDSCSSKVCRILSNKK